MAVLADKPFKKKPVEGGDLPHLWFFRMRFTIPDFDTGTASFETVPFDGATGEILKTGDVVTVDLDKATVTVEGDGKEYSFKSLGEVRPVVDAGGLFNYARETGMMPKAN